MNSEKSKRGVLVRLTASDVGMFVTLDDVEQQLPLQKNWLQRELITTKEIDEVQFDRLEFDEKELANFGYYIMARLHAFKSMGESP